MIKSFTKLFKGSSIRREGEEILFSFREKFDPSKWRLISDKEVGGHSKASFEWDPQEYAVFKGNISKKLPENNPRITSSGYAGVYSPTIDISYLDMERYNTLVLRVNTDGKTYAVGLLKSDERQVMYKSIFTTSKANQWETIEIPLDDFFKIQKGTVVLDLEQMKRENISNIGFIQSERSEGPFELKIDYMKLSTSDLKPTFFTDSRTTSTTGRPLF
ncbi:hypothetical protein CYY_002867 [Polysphondylium violaceum]|uniref:NADH:ubiquinone oxidoreductase intermediate-associated protein 30 domain-containing protein n=1 Tax=Polysphondylium violaceum TaxID=133409 RepID=A0A8J4PXH3_9MYCE|nr:hypothetical protein CYY_002867 [Polysphondylium violaceum]